MMETTVSARGSSRSVRYGPGECRPDAPGSRHEIGAGGRDVKGRGPTASVRWRGDRLIGGGLDDIARP